MSPSRIAANMSTSPVRLALLKLRRGDPLPARISELAEARDPDDVLQVVQAEQPVTS